MTPEVQKKPMAELLKEYPPLKTCGEFPSHFFGIHEISVPRSQRNSSSSTSETYASSTEVHRGPNLCHPKLRED